MDPGGFFVNIHHCKHIHHFVFVETRSKVREDERVTRFLRIHSFGIGGDS